jgi:hypothetical protein
MSLTGSILKGKQRFSKIYKGREEVGILYSDEFDRR